MVIYPIKLLKFCSDEETEDNKPLLHHASVSGWKILTRKFLSAATKALNLVLPSCWIISRCFEIMKLKSHWKGHMLPWTLGQHNSFNVTINLKIYEITEKSKEDLHSRILGKKEKMFIMEIILLVGC